MTRLVADASAIVDLLAGAASAPSIRDALAGYAEVDVPEHFHVEAISALRALLARGDLSRERAERALALLLELRVLRHPVGPLAGVVWSLRETLSAYDAAYLAVARAVNARVVTADRGLAAAARAEDRLVELA